MTAGGVVSQILPAAREPDKWSVEFTGWDSLATAFDPLKKAGMRSRNVKVKESGAELTSIAGPAFDDAAAWSLPKTCLLNLFAKLQLVDPVSSARSWFSYVDALLVVGRERFVATCEPALA
ncbi:MAG: hypothetical protein ACRD96_27750, partial [Bryobacteraceae bacterium]